MYTGYRFSDNHIDGPRGYTGYWLLDDHVYSQSGYIYGPETRLPW